MSRPIVVVADHLAVNGGSARVAVESALGLAAAGHRVLCVGGAGAPDPRLAAAGIPVRIVAPPERARGRAASAVRVIWNADAGRAVAESLAQAGPEAIAHVHSWGQEMSGATFAAVRGAGAVGVVTLHDFLSVCPNGTFFDFGEAAICTRAPLSGACIARACDAKPYPFKLMRLARHAATARLGRLFEACPDAIVLSALHREVIAPHLPPGMRLHRVANPVEIDAPDGPPAPRAPDAPFLFVGRLTPEKGAALFARAAATAGVPAVFVGDGPEADAIRAENPRARLLGWQAPERVAALMRTARALVFPSLWYETQGLVALEAQAAGTPVVVSDGCAAREFVRDGETGLHVPSGDVQALAARLVRLASDPDLAERLGRAAQAAFLADPPSRAAHVAALETVYERAAAAQAGARPRRPGARERAVAAKAG
ncbi:glycosyltransferase family 4 protein [Salinarimonas rosea]|uniref:glycosyltransferase family 4 protein n=1 Tax=Salinarimonas rosea TaxID=552063 RepID=UPI0003FCA9EF|nr:glycosyltransferase family 4 protein [Salinarimonas rosea]